MEPDWKQLASIDRVIHEPARLMIASLLAAVEEADFQYLHQATGLTKGNLSVHLSKLEKAGYVAIEKTYRGKVPLTLCRLTAGGAEALARYKAVMKAAL
jgi:DNA-binding transcriptional ArsR family regulator